MEHLTAEIFGLKVNLDTLLTMWLCMGVIIIFAFIGTRKLSIIPTKIQFLFESILGFFWDLTDTMIGKGGRRHVPLLASLFLFILVGNLCGQLPWKLYHLKQGELASPTNDINLTAAFAIIVLVYYMACGIAKKKFKFFIHGFSFVDIILFLVELLEMFTRPLTLTLRLFGNILAGEILITAIISLCAFVLPIPFMVFELLVAAVQALVFTMLTTVYISSAVSEEH